MEPCTEPGTVGDPALAPATEAEGYPCQVRSAGRQLTAVQTHSIRVGLPIETVCCSYCTAIIKKETRNIAPAPYCMGGWGLGATYWNYWVATGTSKARLVYSRALELSGLVGAMHGASMQRGIRPEMSQK